MEANTVHWDAKARMANKQAKTTTAVLAIPERHATPNNIVLFESSSGPWAITMQMYTDPG